MNNDLAEKVYKIVAQIPIGFVVSYGEVAKIVKTSPRVVGNYLHRNSDPQNIPCHRVVNKQGKLAENYAFGGSVGQKRRLLEEGVKFLDGKVDRRYFTKIIADI